ncbi:hypothetical protein JJD41_18965 [Oxynema sp. CENA135]|uniref:hypothetical protein n=1 Tax=Oxynema sp. CENA135 TaxID=984206 RepID=UPI00190B7865|nr:hypothetical protein [Oxynema sp. CENA135]MBK4731935.1 hypothetical protein [Oxynema sp. CENA135]
MAQQKLSPAQANLKMALWQVEADSISSKDLYVWLNDLGLPTEASLRLHELMTVTKKVGSKIFSIGKIIVIKILEFVKDNPFLVAGLGIAGTVGLAIFSLITSIPLLGQLLSPLAACLGIAITITGGVVGYHLDLNTQGLGDDVMAIAKHFFDFLADVLNLIFKEVVTA